MHFQQTQEFVFCAPLTVVAAPRRHGACNVITVVGCAMLLLDGFAWLVDCCKETYEYGIPALLHRLFIEVFQVHGICITLPCSSSYPSHVCVW